MATQKELIGFARELLAAEGHNPTSAEYKALPVKPITLSKSMDDEALTEEIVRYATEVASNGFGGQGISVLSDECAVFLLEQNVVVVPDAEDDVLGDSVELTEESLFGAEDEDDGLEALAEGVSEIDPFGSEDVGEQLALEVEDAPMQTTDDKVAALDAEQGPVALVQQSNAPARQAAITIQNLEMGVLAIIELLREGKVVMISATDITSAAVVGEAVEMSEPLACAVSEDAEALTASEDAPEKSQRKARGSKAEVAEPSPELIAASVKYVCRWKKDGDAEAAKVRARTALGILGKDAAEKKAAPLASDTSRRRFIVANKIPLQAKYDVNSVTGKPLANAIVRWFVRTRVAE